MQLKPGSTLQDGKYRIIRVLGQGGFGITYLAEHTMLDRKMAIKEFFPKEYCNRDNSTSHITVGTLTNVQLVEKLRRRFLKEAKNLSNLDHEGIVRIHDVFEENESAYYVMDYIEGESLSEIVKSKGALDEKHAVDYIRQVAKALQYIHSRNMTHFDVKPANIMVRRSDNRPILIDFGLSKQYTAEGNATTTGLKGVSHGYSAIEMYNPNFVLTFSPKSDVYSLGATLLYLLTAQTPPDVHELTESPLPIPAIVSDNVANAIRESMRVSRNERCADIAGFLSLLDAEAAGASSEFQSAETANTCAYTSKTSVESNDAVDTTEQTVIIGSITDDASNCGDREKDEVAGKTQIIDTPNDHHNGMIIDEQTGEIVDDSEPTSWDRFVTNISSTNRLVDTYSISNARKIGYFFTSVVIFILSIPLGWIFWIVLFHRIQGALKKLFFPYNISEFDYGSDYTKAKCWGIISIPIIVVLIEITMMVIGSLNSQPQELKDYVNDYNANAPYSMMEAQISSIELEKNNLVFLCNASDNKHKERDYLNNLNVDLWKPILAIEDSIINKDGYLRNYIFRFINNNNSIKEVVVPSSSLKEYKSLSEGKKMSQFLNSYISLENEFVPYSKNDGIILRDVSISESSEGFDRKEYLKYTFVDPNDRLSVPGWTVDSIRNYIWQQIPLGYPFLLESVAKCTDGITFQINEFGKPEKEIILCTSDEILKINQ